MRDAIIIFVAIILSMMIGSYLFFNGVPSATPPVGPSLVSAPEEPVVVIAEGQDSGSITRRTNFLIRSEEEFAELWSMVYGASGSVRPLIDFSRYDVIAAFDGTRSSGGYHVEVSDVREEGGSRVIEITRHEPEDDCIVTEAITSPFQMVRVLKSPLPVSKAERIVTTQCN